MKINNSMIISLNNNSLKSMIIPSITIKIKSNLLLHSKKRMKSINIVKVKLSFQRMIHLTIMRTMSTKKITKTLRKLNKSNTDIISLTDDIYGFKPLIYT